MDYTAIGDTTNLAQRLQSVADPGMVEEGVQEPELRRAERHRDAVAADALLTGIIDGLQDRRCKGSHGNGRP